jgi:DNA repair protein RadA/Sms
VFVCQKCSTPFPKAKSQCSNCASWDSIIDEREARRNEHSVSKSNRPNAVAMAIADVETEDVEKVPSGIDEFDRAMGGGAVLGGVTLVGGDPGIGKSTLLMQALFGYASEGIKSLYVSGEESASQIALRARRISEGEPPPEVMLFAESDWDEIEKTILEIEPEVLVIDSIQTMRALDGPAGTVSQLREVTSRVVGISKRENISTFLIGHVTKDGAIAGPKVVEHLVDTVLAFEANKTLRVLRASKNRFGKEDKGIFEMTEQGMMEVPNASEFFLAERAQGVSGSVIAATYEGTRAMLVEVQALARYIDVGIRHATPKRISNGIDAGRLSMILAVLEKLNGRRVGDVFINIAGGMRVEEPALDLALALTVVSSLQDTPLAADIAVFGEIGLSGEVRGVEHMEVRLAEAKSMGFKRVIVPASFTTRRGEAGAAAAGLIRVGTVEEALEYFDSPKDLTGRLAKSVKAAKTTKKASAKKKSKSRRS